MAKFFASDLTFAVGDNWQGLSEASRVERVRDVRASDPRFQLLSIVSANATGEVIVSLNDSVGASLRGTLLLDFEDALKSKVDMGLVVWVEPMNDRNRLRHLRGVTVKSV